jgi:hypothetical protein
MHGNPVKKNMTTPHPDPWPSPWVGVIVMSDLKVALVDLLQM